MTVICKDYSYRGEHFYVVFDGKFYCTINHKLIGQDGHPVKTLTYADRICANKNLLDSLEECKRYLDLDYYLSIGLTKAQAFAKIFNVSEEIFEQAFNS